MCYGTGKYNVCVYMVLVECVNVEGGTFSWN